MTNITDRERQLVWALLRMVQKHCRYQDSFSQLCSNFISSDADAMLLLGEYKIIKITNDNLGRCIGGHVISDERVTKQLSKRRKK